MANNQKLSPQGYNIKMSPVNDNPLWKNDDGGGGNVPAGGSTGQVLTKRTDEDYDTVWADPTGGGGGVTPAEVQTIVDQNLDPVKANIADIEAEQTTQNTAISENTSDISSLDVRVTNVSGRAENIYNELDGRVRILEARDDEENERLDNLEALTAQHTNDITDLTTVSNSLNGGSVGQLLAKRTNNDKDYLWIDPPESSGVTIEQVRAVTDPIDARVTTNTDSIDALQTRLPPVESSLTTLQTQVLQAQENIQTNAANIDTNSTSLYNLETRVSNHDADIARIDGEISNINTSLSSVESDISSVKGDLEPLNEAINGAGTTGEVLTRTGAGVNEFAWEQLTIPPDLSGRVSNVENQVDILNTRTQTLTDITTPLVSGGKVGQVLTKTGTGQAAYQWRDPAGGETDLEPRVEALEDRVTATEGDITTLDDLVNSHTTRLDTNDAIVEALAQRTNPLVTAGVIGQVLTKTGDGDTGYTWQNPPAADGAITQYPVRLNVYQLTIRGVKTDGTSTVVYDFQTSPSGAIQFDTSNLFLFQFASGQIVGNGDIQISTITGQYAYYAYTLGGTIYGNVSNRLSIVENGIIPPSAFESTVEFTLNVKGLSCSFANTSNATTRARVLFKIYKTMN